MMQSNGMEWHLLFSFISQRTHSQLRLMSLLVVLVSFLHLLRLLYPQCNSIQQIAQHLKTENSFPLHLICSFSILDCILFAATNKLKCMGTEPAKSYGELMRTRTAMRVINAYVWLLLWMTSLRMPPSPQPQPHTVDLICHLHFYV